MRPRYEHIYVSVKEENATWLIGKGIELLENLQPPWDIALSRKRDGYLTIKHTNSTIKSISSKAAGGRGFNADVTLDELASIPEETALMNAILQGTVRKGWTAEFISTPFGQSGEFFNIWNDAGWDVDSYYEHKSQEKVFDKEYRKFLDQAPDD